MKDVEYAAAVADATRIMPEALQEEFTRLPADLAYWNEQYSRAYREYLRAEMFRKEVEAQLGILLRDHLQAMGSKATVSEVEQRVLTHDQYRSAKEAEIEAETAKVRAWGVVEALRAKREMLVSVGAHVRAEMAGDPLVRQRAHADQAVAAARR